MTGPARGVLLAAALALGAVAMVTAQDVRAQAAAPAAQQVSPSDAAPAPANGGPASGAAGSGAAAADTSSASTTKHPPVCFKLTGRCVEPPKGRAAATKGAASKEGTTNKRPLNLTAPDVRTVVPAEELKEPLPTTDQIAETQESQTVSVKTEGVPVDVPGGFGALWWALNHPSQAWRILTPAE